MTRNLFQRLHATLTRSALVCFGDSCATITHRSTAAARARAAEVSGWLPR